MANINLYFPKQQKWEGGFVNHPNDPGGATNRGVTLSTWRALGYDKDGDGDIDAQDIRLLSESDAKKVLKVAYWDRWKADAITNQSVAETLVEWVWGSGKWGIIIPQRILKVVQDGQVGMRTIAAVNSADAETLWNEIKTAKLTYIDLIIKQNPKLEVFKKGWLNRIEDFKYKNEPFNQH